MRLRELEVNNFKGITQKQLELASGINVVYGPNESGKSTIFAAILALIFDFPTGKKSEEEFRPWHTDNFPRITGVVDLSQNASYVTIVKDYSTTTARITSEDEDLSRRDLIEDWLRNYLGTSNEKLFLSSVYISHEQLQKVSGERALVDEIWRILSSEHGDISINDAIKKLENRVKELNRGIDDRVRTNFGPLREVRDRIEALDKRIVELKDELRVQKSEEESLSELKKKFKETKSDIEVKQGLLNAYKDRTALNNQLRESSDEETKLDEKIEKIQNIQKEIDELESRLGKPEFESIADLSDDVRSEIKSKHNAYLKALENRPSKPIPSIQEPSAKPTSNNKNLIIGVIALTALVFAVVGILVDQLLISIISVVIGLVLAIAIRMRSADAPGITQNKSEEVDRPAPEGAKEALRSILTNHDFSDYEEYEARLKEYEEIKGELQNQREIMKAHLDGESLDEIEAKRKEASKKRRDAEEKLEEIQDSPTISAVEHQELMNKVDQLIKEQDSLRTQISKLEGKIEGKSPVAELDLVVLEERKLELEREERHHQDYFDTLTCALEMLQATKKELEDSLHTILGEKLSDNFGRITNQRYSHVVVDNELNVHVMLGDQEISPDLLSSGTRDQLYFAIRLTLLDILFHDRKIPLIMDDPFINFDHDRLKNAYSLLTTLAQDRQIILFTCHEHFTEWTDNIIRFEPFS